MPRSVVSLPYGPGYGYRLGIGTMDDKYIDAGIAAQTELGTYSLEVRDGEQSGSVLASKCFRINRLSVWHDYVHEADSGCVRGCQCW